MILAFWLAAVFVLYTYAGYPLAIYAYSRIRRRPVLRAAFTPFVSIIMAVRNEERGIDRKVRNLLALDYPPDLYEVIVVSDGSTDRTNEILADHADHRVHILASTIPLGKAAALNRALECAHGEIMVFTDARQRIGRDSVRKLIENFADSSVGCVSGELLMGSGSEGKEDDQGMGLYWRLEKKIRKWESDAGSVIGATGALYAVRKELIVPFPPGTILDDVYLPLHVIKKSSRVLFEPEALAFDSIASSRHEFRRKVRTLMGNYQLVQLAPWVVMPSSRAFIQFLSHKLFRLWVPFALAVVFLSSWLLNGLFYQLVFALQLVLYGLALVSLGGFNLGVFKRVAKVAFTVVMLNTAAMAALVYFVKGEKSIWKSPHPAPACEIPYASWRVARRTEFAMKSRNQPKTLSEWVPLHSFTFAYASLYVFVLIYFARPEDWIPGLAVLRPAFIAGALAIAGFLLAAMRSRAGLLGLPRQIWYLVALFFQLFAAAVFSPVWRGGAFQVVAYTFSKVVLIAIVITLAVTTLGRLRKLVFIQASAFVLVAIVSILESRDVGGRLMGTLNGIYGNPNDLAFAIALGFPLCWIFLHRTTNIIKKLAWTACMAAMGYAVFLTASRSGLIVLLISLMICLWQFGLKGGRRHLLVIVAFAAVVVVAVAPKKLMEERFAGFESPAESRSAYGSFQQRQGLLLTSLQITGEHPLFGIGPGDFPIISGNWHVSHNSLTELSAEGGVAALVLFLLMVKESFSNLADTEQYCDRNDELELWRSGLKVALITLLVGSLFSSVEYEFFPYMLMAYAAAFHRIASRREDRVPQREPVNAKIRRGRFGLRLPENAGSIAAFDVK